MLIKYIAEQFNLSQTRYTVGIIKDTEKSSLLIKPVIETTQMPSDNINNTIIVEIHLDMDDVSIRPFGVGKDTTPFTVGYSNQDSC